LSQKPTSEGLAFGYFFNRVQAGLLKKSIRGIDIATV